MNRKTLTELLEVFGIVAMCIGLGFLLGQNWLGYGLSLNIACILWIGAFLAKGGEK